MSSVPLSWKAEVSKPIDQVELRWSVFAAIALVGCGLDLWTKQWVFNWRGIPGTREPWWLIDGLVGIETAVNLGALFGMGAGWGSIFATLSVLAAIGIVVWLARFGALGSWWLLVALGCVMGGIGGNLYDRLGLWYQSGYPLEWKSGVRDWILLRYEQYTWPNFNIADSLLVCGAIMLAIHSFMTPPESEVGRGEAPTTAGGVNEREVS